MHIFKINDTIPTQWKCCVIHERIFMVQQVLSTVNGSEHNSSIHCFARAKRLVRCTCFDYHT